MSFFFSAETENKTIVVIYFTILMTTHFISFFALINTGFRTQKLNDYSYLNFDVNFNDFMTSSDFPLDFINLMD